MGQTMDKCQKAEYTHHMTSSINASKRQLAARFRLTSSVPVHQPRPPDLLLVRFVTSPVKLIDPKLVGHPITLPVVCPGIDQNTDTTLEKSCDIILGMMRPLVQMRNEVAENWVGAHGEISRTFGS